MIKSPTTPQNIIILSFKNLQFPLFTNEFEYTNILNREYNNSVWRTVDRKEEFYIMKKLVGLIFSMVLVSCVFVPASAYASTGYTPQNNNSGLLTMLLSFLNLGSQNQTSSQYDQTTQYQQNQSKQSSSQTNQYYQNSQNNSDCWTWFSDLWNFCCGGSDGGHGGDDGGCDNGGGGKDCFSNDHGQCSSADVWKEWYGH
jgi:hypothetical protein